MISLIIPVLNEEENIKNLHGEIFKILDSLKENYEVIYIDDGSTDNSLPLLKEEELKNKKIRIFSFRRSRGKSEALTLGFKKAKGDIIITLDADLQDDPKAIPQMIEILKKGYDCVCGWRKDRKDKPLTIYSSKFFNWVSGKFWRVEVHDFNCGLKVYTKEAAKSLTLYGGMHRFIPLLLQNEGFKLTELPINHQKRKFGKSKYGVSKIFKDLPDMFTILFLSTYSERPSHFFSAVGGIFSLVGFIFLLYLSIMHWFYNQRIGTRPLWSVGVLFVLIGLQTIFTGFLADLMINIYHERREEKDFDNKIKYHN